MTLNRYDFLVSEDFMAFEFCSEGPNGKIKKLVLFTQITSHNSSLFNLAFGDLEDKGIINDFVTSNNQDAEKVLATVAQAVIFFTEKYPNAVVVAEGSTPSRTRRYQMGINKYWNEIEPYFHVFGFNQTSFEPFMSGKNYSALAVIRKKK